MADDIKDQGQARTPALGSSTSWMSDEVPLRSITRKATAFV